MQRRITALWISMALLLVTGTAFAQEEGEVDAMETTDVAEDTSADTSAIPAEEGTDAGGDGASGAKPISVGLLLGFGLDLGGTGNLNPFGLGFGVRGGYNIDNIYLGARFMFFLGDSVDAPGAEASFNVMTIGIEGGYDLVFDKLTVRPELGLGLAVASSESTISIFGMTSTVDGSSTDLYLAPGVSILYDISDSIFIGGNLSIPLVFASSGYQGLELLANVGMRF